MTTTLLAVDDSVTMRKVLEITFAGENFKILLASNGQEALNALKADRPTIALVDHTLPDMSGYDLCRELKAAAPGVAVLVLASKQNPYDKAKGGASGVDDFMDKPFDTQKLLDKVSQVLSGPRATATGGAAAAPVHAPAAPAPAAMPTASARPRSQTLSYGTPAGPGVAQAPAPSAAATPKPGIAAAAPRLAAQQPSPAPAPVAAMPQTPKPASVVAAPVAAAVTASNGQLSGKLEGLGLTPAQVEAVLALSREIVEKVVWEVVPVLAETLIQEEIKRLTSE